MPNNILPKRDVAYQSSLDSSYSDEDHAQMQVAEVGMTLVSYCPLCKTSASPQEAVLLGEKDSANLLHLRCASCSNSLVALIYVSPAGISSVGLLTDLSSKEFGDFKSTPVVSTNDVIETHMMLQNEASFWNRVF